MAKDREGDPGSKYEGWKAGDPDPDNKDKGDQVDKGEDGDQKSPEKDDFQRDSTPDNMKKNGTFFTRNEAGHKFESVKNAKAEMERDLNSRDTTPANMKKNGTFFARNEAGHRIQSINNARAEMDADLSNRAEQSGQVVRSGNEQEGAEPAAERSAVISLDALVGKVRAEGGQPKDILDAGTIHELNEFRLKSPGDRANLPDGEWNRIMDLRRQAAETMNKWLTENMKPEDANVEDAQAESNDTPEQNQERSEYISIRAMQHEVRRLGGNTEKVISDALGADKNERMWQLQDRYNEDNNSLSDEEWEELMDLKDVAGKAMNTWQINKSRESASSPSRENIDQASAGEAGEKR